MGLFKRGPNRLARQLTTAYLETAMSRAEAATAAAPSFADLWDRVRSPQGRKAHLSHAGEPVLCGWPLEVWVRADDSLPLCRPCKAEAAKRDGEGRAA